MNNDTQRSIQKNYESHKKYNEISDFKEHMHPVRWPKEIWKAICNATGKDTEYNGNSAPYIRKAVIRSLIQDGYLEIKQKFCQQRPIDAERSKDIAQELPSTKGSGLNEKFRFLNIFAKRRYKAN